ncbi:SDR family oxidoreductase [candidate division FCPU426 bacterium]|nr:SDR family oxidoreductase [candidate division FCPU426 bacterium]
MRTVLVTGASAGIGLATAKYLADKQWRVFGTTRSLNKRREVAEAWQQQYQGRATLIEMDVTQDQSVAAAVKTILDQHGLLDALVCNAGFGIFGSIEEMPLEKVYEQMETNFFGYVRTIQAVLPSLRQRHTGHIVLVSSIGGVVCIPFQAHYSAAKYAVEALTQGLRQELYATGVKVAAVRPGDIQTEFNDATYRHMPPDSPYQKRCAACWTTIDKNMKIAPKPVLVAKTIYKILNSKNPKAYYTAADFFTGLTPIIAPFLPSKLKEKVIRLFYNIDFK